MAARRQPPPALPAPAFVAHLEEKGVPAVVVFAGAERWFRETCLEAVVQRRLPEGDPGASYVRVDAKRVEDRGDVSGAIDELRSTSLFGGGKVVAIDNAEAASGPWLEGKTSPLTRLAKAGVAAGANTATLALLTSKPVRGASAAPVKTLVKAGALVVDCRALYDAPASWQRGAAPHDHELAHFVQRRLQEVHGKRITGADAHAITRLVGSELGALALALETLALFAGKRTSITLEDVHASLGKTRNDPAWRLADAVAEGDAARAFELLEAALDRGVPDGRGALITAPEALFGFLGATLLGTWRRLLGVSEALARGDDPKQIARAAGVPPFRVEPFLDQCRAWSLADLWDRHEAFLDAELGVKAGTVPARVALERLVARLVAPRQVAPGSGAVPRRP